MSGPRLVSTSPGVVDVQALTDDVMALLAARGLYLSEESRSSVLAGLATGLQWSKVWVDLGDGEGPRNMFEFGRKPSGPPVLRALPGGEGACR